MTDITGQQDMIKLLNLTWDAISLMDTHGFSDRDHELQQNTLDAITRFICALKRNSEARQEGAKEIFERFKAGGRLSTDDLETLLYSGYL